MSTTLSLAGVAAAAALKVVIAGAAGGLTARRLRLDARVLTALSEVNKELFIPLMIFTSCAEGITASMLTHLKGVPVMSLAFMLNGLVCGQLAARLTAAPRAARPITTALCGFSNVVGLPLPLLLSITAAVPALAGPADPSLPEAHAQSLESRTLSYLFLVNVVMSVCMWVCAPRMLAAAAAIAETDARPSVAGGGGYTPGLPYRRCVSARSSAADSSPMLAAGATVGPVAIEMQPSGDCTAAAAACAAAGASEPLQRARREGLQRGDRPGAEPSDPGRGAPLGPGSPGRAAQSGPGSPGRAAQSGGRLGKTACHAPRPPPAARCTRRLASCFAPLLTRPALASLAGVATGATPLRRLVVTTDAPLRLLVLEAEYALLSPNPRSRGHIPRRTRPYSAVFAQKHNPGPKTHTHRQSRNCLHCPRSPSSSRGALSTTPHKTAIPPRCRRMQHT